MCRKGPANNSFLILKEIHSIKYYPCSIKFFKWCSDESIFGRNFLCHQLFQRIQHLFFFFFLFFLRQEEINQEKFIWGIEWLRGIRVLWKSSRKQKVRKNEGAAFQSYIKLSMHLVLCWMAGKRVLMRIAWEIQGNESLGRICAGAECGLILH